jgi:LacI family transcriptional regulator
MSKSRNTDSKDRGVTLVDVARRCGVSLAATSYALAGDRVHVSEETSRRIIATAMEMGYDPARYQAARRLVNVGTGRDTVNHIIAIYVPPEFYETRYFQLIFSGVMAEMMPRRYGVLAVQGLAKDEGELQYLTPKPVVQGDVDAVIIAMHSRVIAMLAERLRNEPNFGHRPAISVINKVDGVSSVTADDYQGGVMAISHLLDLGHRYFMHFTVEYEAVHLRRLQAYHSVLLERGLDPGVHLVHCDWTRLNPHESEPALHQRLAEHPEITAILAFNDETAVQIGDALQRSGLRIPEDMSLVGFDDTHELRDDYGRNTLTTVTVPLSEIGRRATDMAIRHQAERPSFPEHIVMPVSFTLRQSTAPPRRS